MFENKKKILGKTNENRSGYLHTCRVNGYNATTEWAIASSPEEAASKARYGRSQDRVIDSAYPYSDYRIETVECDRDGHFIRIVSVYNLSGSCICSNEESPYSR
jgi:hypothetical protein